MRVIAIGATGFIGRHVVSKLLEAGHEVAVVHRGQTALAPRDGLTEMIRNRAEIGGLREDFAKWAPDVAIDLILSSAAQAEATLAALHGIAPRVVAISSGDVYRAMAVLHGIETGALEPIPLTEKSTIRTRTKTYSKESLAMVRHAYPWVDDDYDKVQVERTIASDPDVAATILRIPMVYGGGDPLHRLYPTVKRMLDGRPVIVLDDSYARWIPCRGYVENAAQAIALAATSAQAAGRVYNVAEPERIPEADWVARIGALANWTGRIVVLPRDKMPAHLKLPYNMAQDLFMDSSRIRVELGYTESVDVDEALRRTIEWERANPPAQVNPALFNYAAEDEAVASLPV